MSKYTTELRFICENAAGLVSSAGYNDIDSIISKAIPGIFDFSFPIFDENYRNVLQTKIIKHFYTREICEETVGLWKLRLNTRLNEVMPYYNKLYESELIEFNPLYDVDLKRNHKGVTDGVRNVEENREHNSDKTDTTNTSNESKSNTTDDGSTNSTQDVTSKYSDTPQGGIEGLADDTHLTNARIDRADNLSTVKNSSENTANSSSDTKFTSNTEDNTKSLTDETNKTTEEYLETVIGKQGTQSYSSLIQEYRTTFLNIDLQVIAELDDLFIQIW